MPDEEPENAPSFDKQASLADVEDGVTLPPEPEVKGPLKPVTEMTQMETYTLGAGGAAAGFAVANIILTGGVMVMVAGALSIVMGPYLYVQRNKLVDIEQFKETQEMMELQLNTLEDNLGKLEGNINSLEESSKNLEKMKETFSVLSSLGGQSIEDFSKQIEKQKQNVKNQGMGLQSQVVTLLMDMIETADADGDNMFDEDEVEVFIESLRNLSGVKIYEDRIRKAMVGQSIFSCYDLIRKLHDDEVPEDEILYDVLVA